MLALLKATAMTRCLLALRNFLKSRTIQDKTFIKGGGIHLQQLKVAHIIRRGHMVTPEAVYMMGVSENDKIFSPKMYTRTVCILPANIVLVDNTALAQVSVVVTAKKRS